MVLIANYITMHGPQNITVSLFFFFRCVAHKYEEDMR